MRKTALLASIVLITGIITSQALAHMGGVYNMMGGNQRGYGNHMGNGMMGSGMMGNDYMMENFSAEDQQTMLEQMNTFFSSTREVREQSYQKQLELNKEYAKSEKDQAKIDSLRKELFDLSSQFEKERFNHMTTMQKLFSDKNTGNFVGMGGRYNNCF
jgi:Spy/CpxP family protein refolding chaperone